MNIATFNYGSANTELERISSKTLIRRNQIIPAVPGEYYSYSSDFSSKNPVYALMSCKANKDRPKIDLFSLGNEANLLFLFNLTGGVEVCSIRDACDLGIIQDSIRLRLRDNTLISKTEMSPEEFYKIRAQKNASALVETCKAVHQNKKTKFAQLKQNMVVSVMTTGGKYGLFLIKEINEMSVKIDACHILI